MGLVSNHNSNAFRRYCPDSVYDLFLIFMKINESESGVVDLGKSL